MNYEESAISSDIKNEKKKYEERIVDWHERIKCTSNNLRLSFSSAGIGKQFSVGRHLEEVTFSLLINHLTIKYI